MDKLSEAYSYKWAYKNFFDSSLDYKLLGFESHWLICFDDYFFLFKNIFLYFELFVNLFVWKTKNKRQKIKIQTNMAYSIVLGCYLSPIYVEFFLIYGWWVN